MKACIPLFAIFISLALSAQEPPVNTARPHAKPPGDPFVKVKPDAKAVPDRKPDDLPPVPWAPPPHHLVFTFETYKLPQSALDALHAEGHAPQAFFDRVRQLVVAGEASLETIIAVPTRSGQRAAFESVDELIYPTEFDPAVPGRPFHFPTAYETRPLGERIEVDPVESPDGNVADLNMSQEFVRLVGFSVAKADPAADGEVQPVFATRKVTTSITCRLGVPTLLGTTSAPKNTGVPGADGDGSVSVTFARYRHCAPGLAEASPVGTEGDESSKNMRIVFRFYSLPREKARDLLAETVDAEKLHSQVTSLPAEEVKLERLITIITRSGQRATTEEIGEWTYGTEVHSSHPPKVEGETNDARKPAHLNDSEVKPGPAQPVFQKGEPLLPAGYSAFEMRPTGWRIEIDPVLAEDGRRADLNLAPQLTEYRGIVQGHPLLSRYPEQPLFATQTITTLVTAAIDRQCFLGTMNRPRETGVNGRKDDGRTWFAFVKVTVE